MNLFVLVLLRINYKLLQQSKNTKLPSQYEVVGALAKLLKITHPHFSDSQVFNLHILAMHDFGKK